MCRVKERTRSIQKENVGERVMAKYTGRIEIFFNSEKDANHFAHVIDSMANMS